MMAGIILADPRHVFFSTVGDGETGIAHPALERHKLRLALPDG
jgi:hypothetical protein